MRWNWGRVPNVVTSTAANSEREEIRLAVGMGWPWWWWWGSWNIVEGAGFQP